MMDVNIGTEYAAAALHCTAAHWADCRDQSQSSSPFTVPRFRGTIEMSGDVWTCQHQEEMVATFPAGGVSMFPITD